MRDPVEEELARLRLSLSGVMTELTNTNSGVVAEAEQLARTARDSRPGMKAVMKAAAGPRAVMAPPRPKVLARPVEDSLTGRFQALKTRAR
jgi:hypothetical protein